eukprot:CAMPEP_0206624834 /NCGR_PEP_ID=MMETSP0325_2-20121206/64405_1 /ASSEMBLY_ACC=CAM_ASM_000347 /TAXON_ID=2866 /ORGANISM="Crypthecodinium cohnii, Strain Seligo" /LENGTH=121 /DNA_ID=CAMNT_0054148961 /DNA_START=119 /DNA_END=480 /DNA_ORIENTATION=-
MRFNQAGVQTVRARYHCKATIWRPFSGDVVLCNELFGLSAGCRPSGLHATLGVYRLYRKSQRQVVSGHLYTSLFCRLWIDSPGFLKTFHDLMSGRLLLGFGSACVAPGSEVEYVRVGAWGA